MFENEDYILYLTYFLIFVIFVVGFVFSKKHKITFRNNLIFFVVYAAVLFIPTLNNDNMKGGSSLFFIVFGWLFLLIYLFGFLSYLIWNFVKRKTIK